MTSSVFQSPHRDSLHSRLPLSSRRRVLSRTFQSPHRDSLHSRLSSVVAHAREYGQFQSPHRDSLHSRRCRRHSRIAHSASFNPRIGIHFIHASTAGHRVQPHVHVSIPASGFTSFTLLAFSERNCPILLDLQPYSNLLTPHCLHTRAFFSLPPLHFFWPASSHRWKTVLGHV